MQYPAYNILIKFPSRGRGILEGNRSMFCDTFNRVRDMRADAVNTRILVSADADDSTMRHPKILDLIEAAENANITFQDHRTKIEAINSGLSEANFDIVILASDDMAPVVDGYDERIREKMFRHFPDLDGVLWFNDGNRADINTLCIVGRKYFDRFGYLYHPDYRSLWCDVEFTKVSQQLKRVQYFQEVIFRHLHPDYLYKSKCSKAEIRENHYDRTYRENFAHVEHDHIVFRRRERSNFDQ